MVHTYVHEMSEKKPVALKDCPFNSVFNLHASSYIYLLYSIEEMYGGSNSKRPGCVCWCIDGGGIITFSPDTKVRRRGEVRRIEFPERKRKEPESKSVLLLSPMSHFRLTYQSHQQEYIMIGQCGESWEHDGKTFFPCRCFSLEEEGELDIVQLSVAEDRDVLYLGQVYRIDVYLYDKQGENDD